MDINKLELKELSRSEQRDINGGADWLVWTWGVNPYFDTLASCYNYCVAAYNWITGTPTTYRYIKF